MFIYFLLVYIVDHTIFVVECTISIVHFQLLLLAIISYVYDQFFFISFLYNGILCGDIVWIMFILMEPPLLRNLVLLFSYFITWHEFACLLTLEHNSAYAFLGE